MLRLSVLCSVVLALTIQQTAYAADPDIVSFRQLIMKQLDSESAGLGLIISEQVPPDNLAFQARAIASTAKATLKAFEPKVAGGASKPEVWSNWADFSNRLQRLVQGTEELAKAAERNDMGKVKEFADSSLRCKECHDMYRIKK